MIENLLSIITRLFFTLVAIGLAVALFFIGIIALWYILLVGTVIFLARRVYFWWKTRNSGPIQSGEAEILTRESSTETRTTRGRTIDHE